MKPIIDEERYRKLSQMLQGNESDINLVINIVDNCDIPKSFVYILILISRKTNTKYTLCTPLIKSPNLYSYLGNILSGINNIPTDHNLSIILNLYKKHCKWNKISHDTQIQKYIIGNYLIPTKTSNFSPLITGLDPLKPKKNVRKRNP